MWLGRRSAIVGLSSFFFASVTHPSFGQSGEEEEEAPDPTYDFPMGAVLLTQEALETIPSFLLGDLPDQPPQTYVLSPLPGSFRQRGGSCSAWACANAMSILRARQLGLTTVSRRDTFDAQYVYDSMWRNLGSKCDYASGFPVQHAMDFFKAFGAPLWGQKHSICDSPGDTIVPAQLERGLRMRRSGAVFRFYKSSDAQSEDFEDMFRIVAGGYPVILTISATSRFVGFVLRGASDTLENYDPAPEELAAETKNKHAICLVGYDERRALVMNSWGSGWGYKGFAWVDKVLLRKLLREAYGFDYIM